MTQSKQQGFTLIELSIVLVIIGLIVGGVLTGQSLIQAAQIRATVSQIEKFDTAANAFQGKYNGLPGDLQNCGSYFADSACSSDPSLIAGNGKLEDTAGTYVLLSGEPVMFFHHMYLANLISDPATDTTAIDAVGQVAPATTFAAGKIGSGTYIYPMTVASAITFFPGMNGMTVYRIGGISTDGSSAPTDTDTLTPAEALQIDNKRDDGLPNSGGVQAIDQDTETAFNATVAAPTYSSTTCLSTASTYNMISSPNTRLCQLLVRPSF